MEKRPFEKLGKRVAALRKAAGWRNGIAFAERAGIASASLRDIERGVSEGRIETRRAIAELIGCDVNDLYSDSEIKKIPATDLTPATLKAIQEATRASVLAAIEESKSLPNNFEPYKTHKQELIELIDGLNDLGLEVARDFVLKLTKKSKTAIAKRSSRVG